MSDRVGSSSIAAAGWNVSLVDVGAIHAPLNWVFPDADEAELAWLPCNALLCRRTDDVVLIDCGLGLFTDVFSLEIRHVELADALASVGCHAADVSTVLLTHLDADHAGGIVTGEADRLQPSLPSAHVVVLDRALEVFDGRAAERSEFAEAIGATLRSGGVRITDVGDGSEVAPGLRVRSLPGHRSGHAGVELSGGGERFVYLGDVIHAREHVEHAEWDFLHDSEPEVALATRRALTAELAGSDAIVACSHVDSFGRIERNDDGMPAWVDLV